jgi:hypothetical protein
MVYVIPKKDRAMLSEDPWMESCKGITDSYKICGKRTQEWHHALKYRNRKVQRWFAIVPLCVECHRGQMGTIRAINHDWCELLAIQRDTESLKKECPKRDWDQRLKFLLNMFSRLREK